MVQSYVLLFSYLVSKKLNFKAKIDRFPTLMLINFLLQILTVQCTEMFVRICFTHQNMKKKNSKVSCCTICNCWQFQYIDKTAKGQDLFECLGYITLPASFPSKIKFTQSPITNFDNKIGLQTISEKIFWFIQALHKDIVKSDIKMEQISSFF